MLVFLFHRNIEDILAEKGETVKRLSENDSLEFLVEDAMNKTDKAEQAEDKDRT